MKQINIKYMERALLLAEKGIGATSPNPRVGAVVVKNNRIIGEGWHKKAGDPHAEVIALKEAGEKAKRATLYVTLEPCSTVGRTPPCTDAILKSGISKVVIGVIDPNPVNFHKGINFLKKNGIKVETGVLMDKCAKLNEGFAKYITQGLPFVTLKLAMSLDGKIATRTGDSKWITGEKARYRAHIMRNRSDAILVGINTVKKDNPHLTVRLEKTKINEPKKIIVDSQAEIGLESNILSDDLASSTIIAVTSAAPESKLQKISDAGAEILVCKDDNGRVDFTDLMRKIAEKGIIYVLVEGGGTIAAEFLEKRLADKIAFFYAPKIIGGKDAVAAIGGLGIDSITEAIEIKDMGITRIDDEYLIEGYIKN